MIKHLVNLASEFDKLGRINQANVVDKLIIKVSAENGNPEAATINYDMLEELLDAPDPYTLLKSRKELEESMDVPEPRTLNEIERLMEVPEPGQEFIMPDWIWRKPEEGAEKEPEIGEEIIGYLPPPDDSYIEKP
jgi:hypothetical protein